MIRRLNWIFKPRINHFQVINNCDVMNHTCLKEECSCVEGNKKTRYKGKWHPGLGMTWTLNKKNFQLLNIFFPLSHSSLQLSFIVFRRRRQGGNNKNEGIKKKKFTEQNRLYNESFMDSKHISPVIHLPFLPPSKLFPSQLETWFVTRTLCPSWNYN